MVKRQSKAQSGKAFEQEIQRSLKAFAGQYTMYYRRIQDFRDWIAYNVRLRKRQVPGDFEALYRGVYFLLECKSSRGKRFVMTWLRKHQREALQKVEECGGRGYILFSKRMRPVLCRAIRIHDYLKLEEENKAKRRKSVPVSEMLEIGIELPRLRQSFDMSPIFLIEPQKESIRGVKIHD